MKTNTENLETDTYYHIFNRGINKGKIFFEERNYNYFLTKYAKYIYPIAKTYAYCLLGNHFHFLIKTRSEEEIRNKYSLKSESDLHKAMSKQFSHFFNSYAQSINKANERTGALFENPFRRLPIKDDSHFTQLICYIHLNPQKHGIAKDYKTYHNSSYQNILSNKTTKLEREDVISWFGDKVEFQRIHQEYSNYTFQEDAFFD
jgi:putative transposase